MSNPHDLPPSYDSLAPSSSSSHHLGTGFSSTPQLNPLSNHLNNLPVYIRQTQSITANTQADRDLDTLDHILPHVESLLLTKDIATTRSGVTELVLVPAGEVDGSWELSGLTERKREGDLVRVGRVEVPTPIEKGKGAKPWDEDEGDEGSLWWKDEDMARRLAAYLQPKEQVRTERKEVKAEVELKKKERGLFRWGRKKSEDTAPSSSTSASHGAKGGAVGRDEGISMRVRKDEVTFRRENDFGVWESMDGFAIVVTIRVKRRLE